MTEGLLYRGQEDLGWSHAHDDAFELAGGDGEGWRGGDAQLAGAGEVGFPNPPSFPPTPFNGPCLRILDEPIEILGLEPED